MKTRLTLKSRNKKTGPIPVSTTERKSCPDTCPFKKNGCYADGGPLAIVWNQTSDIGDNWKTFCGKIKDLKPGQLWRHNQAVTFRTKKGLSIKAKWNCLSIPTSGKKVLRIRITI
jgi:hypothetical protein